jgi:hypothetical protein
VARRPGGAAGDLPGLHRDRGDLDLDARRAARRLRGRGRSAKLWKALALPLGCAAAYGVVVEQWVLAGAGLLLLAALAALFRLPAARASAADAAVVSQLEERMKKCC